MDVMVAVAIVPIVVLDVKAVVPVIVIVVVTTVVVIVLETVYPVVLVPPIQVRTKFNIFKIIAWKNIRIVNRVEI